MTVPPLNRQAFYPIIAVANNGAIGVSYYDFRFNTPDPGLPTDYWLVRCRPSSAKPASDPANWGSELRLTDASFNMEACPIVLDGYWQGDYFGLAPLGRSGFVSSFGVVDGNNISSIFARRVGD